MTTVFNLCKEVFDNWNGKSGLDAAVVNQLRDDESDFAKSCITDGEGIDAKTAEFAVFCDPTTGNLYPRQDAKTAFASDLSYFVSVVPVKALNAVTNAGMGLYKTARGISEIRKNWSDKEFSRKEVFRPVGNHFWYALKDGAALGAGAVAYSYLPVVAVGALGTAILASVYNPIKMRTYIGRFEQWWNVKPLTDGEVWQLSTEEKVKQLLLGTYSLSRFFDLQCMGNRRDKVNGEEKFDFVKKG